MGCVSSRARVKPKPRPLQLPEGERPSDIKTCTDTMVTSSQASPYTMRWKQGNLIGQGAYGHVYECFNEDTGQLYALKHVSLSGDPETIQREVANLRREISTLRELSHKNIVKYIQAELASDSSGVDIILEYVPGGSVRQLLNWLNRFEERMARGYIAQLLQGLSYLHHKGIIHRDVKCANVLVEVTGNIKITDFGASKRLTIGDVNEDYVVCKSLKGSPYWMAPEVARRIGHSYPADIWSVGCTLIEMLTGKPPWSDLSTNCKEVLELISRAESAPKYPENLTPECRSFLDNCLQINPDQRASADLLLTHCFITGKIATVEEIGTLMVKPEIERLPSPKDDGGRTEGVKIKLPSISLKSKSPATIKKDTQKSQPVEFSAKRRKIRTFFAKSMTNPLIRE